MKRSSQSMIECKTILVLQNETNSKNILRQFTSSRKTWKIIISLKKNTEG